MELINLLPQIGEYVHEDGEGQVEVRNKDVDFMGLIAESSRVSRMNSRSSNVTQSKSWFDLIEFKWDQFAYSWHSVGWNCYPYHILQIIVLIVYATFRLYTCNTTVLNYFLFSVTYFPKFIFSHLKVYVESWNGPFYEIIFLRIDKNAMEKKWKKIYL